MKKIYIVILISLFLSSLFFFFQVKRTLFVFGERTQMIFAEITMYNPVEWQTDDTPLITASGTTVNEKTAACPEFLEFGTEIEVEGKKYVCEDRMNKRYRSGNYFDLLAFSYDDAIEFGRQNKVVTIYEN